MLKHEITLRVGEAAEAAGRKGRIEAKAADGFAAHGEDAAADHGHQVFDLVVFSLGHGDEGGASRQRRKHGGAVDRTVTQGDARRQRPNVRVGDGAVERYGVGLRNLRAGGCDAVDVRPTQPTPRRRHGSGSRPVTGGRRPSGFEALTIPAGLWSMM